MAEASGSGVAPEAGPSPDNDLWGSILDSVKSTRVVATKNLIVLGKLKAGGGMECRVWLGMLDV